MTSQSSTTDRIPSPGEGLTVAFRRAVGFVPTGVAILSAPSVAMTVSSLHCVSFDPPLVSVALAKDSRKAAIILANGRFHVRLLRSGEENLCQGEKTPLDAGLVEMECAISAIHPAGDHDLVLASVGGVTITNGYPMVSWRRGLHGFRPHYDFMVSRQAFEQFVAAWEDRALPKDQWTHAAHVAIGAHYGVRYPNTAFERIKVGICRFNEAVGTENSDTSGYHETLTRMWADVIAKVVRGFDDPWNAVQEAVEKLGQDRDLHRLYYSFDVVRNTEARRRWMPPDLEGPY
jgi:flavin reductase (DIM6/NTAB) family NADH-FMN oxidoreductase RutF